MPAAAPQAPRRVELVWPAAGASCRLPFRGALNPSCHAGPYPVLVPRERPPYAGGKRQLGGIGRSAPGATDLLTGFAL